MKRRKVFIVVPAFQARKTLRKTVAGVINRVDRVIVVDDGSSDGTYLTVTKFHRKVDLIRKRRNSGVGGAMKTGIAKALDAGADVVVKMDADDQMDPGYLTDLIGGIEDKAADCTKGSRWKYGINRKSIPKMRLLGNTFLTLITRFATGYWNLSDPNNGYVAWDREILRKINWEDVHDRYFFETSMLVQLNVLSAKVAEVPMKPIYQGEKSSLNELKMIPCFSWNLIKYGLKRWWLKYFLYDMSAVSIFLIFGGLLSLFGFIWGSYQWWWHAERGIVTPTGTVMLSVLPLLVGINLLIQALVLDITASRK